MFHHKSMADVVLANIDMKSFRSVQMPCKYVISNKKQWSE